MATFAEVRHGFKSVVAAGILAAGVSVGGATQAAIVPVVFDGIFNDGGALTGGLNFDQDCTLLCAGAYSEIDLFTSGGSSGLAPANYTSAALPGLLSTQFWFVSFAENVLGLLYLGDLRDLTLGGSISFLGIEVGQVSNVFAFLNETKNLNTDSYCHDCFDKTKRFVHGRLTVAPVPAALPALLTGLAALGGLAWRRRRGGAAA